MAFRGIRSAAVRPMLALGALASLAGLAAPLGAAPPRVTSCVQKATCQVVALSVQFDDSAGFLLRSDGAGPYVDGVDNVTAQLRANGEFLFNNGTLLPSARAMTADYSNPLPGSGAYSLLLQPGAHFYWDIADTATIAIQELQLAASMCKSAYIKSDDGSEFYSALFQSGIEGSTGPTGKWLITRVSATTWTIENSPVCAGDVVNLRHQLPPTKRNNVPNWETIGYYHLPFKLILTAQ